MIHLHLVQLLHHLPYQNLIMIIGASIKVKRDGNGQEQIQETVKVLKKRHRKSKHTVTFFELWYYGLMILTGWCAGLEMAEEAQGLVRWMRK